MVKRIPKLPDTLKVGAMVYRVETNNDFLDGLEAHGATNHNVSEIRLSDKAPLLQRQDTTLHEAIHAVNKIYCQGAELSEEQTSALAHGLLQVMHDNPVYTALILGRQ